MVYGSYEGTQSSESSGTSPIITASSQPLFGIVYGGFDTIFFSFINSSSYFNGLMISGGAQDNKTAYTKCNYCRATYSNSSITFSGAYVLPGTTLRASPYFITIPDVMCNSNLTSYYYFLFY